ncbi:MAG TPA: response regulator transcription factor [Terriglobales bacterium]|nr:response regulator transcription factor [Terriglobales bacterium]
MGETTPPSFTTARILVVDDFEPWRRSVCSILQAQRQLFVVGEAANGLEAVQKAQELKADLILLDIRLPALNGIEAAKRIRQVVAGVKIVFVTQHRDLDTVRVALATGAQGYVWKADAGRDLLPAIEAVLRGENFVSSRLKGQGPDSH